MDVSYMPRKNGIWFVERSCTILLRWSPIKMIDPKVYRKWQDKHGHNICSKCFWLHGYQLTTTNRRKMMSKSSSLMSMAYVWITENKF